MLMWCIHNTTIQRHIGWMAIQFICKRLQDFKKVENLEQYTNGVRLVGVFFLQSTKANVQGHIYPNISSSG